MRSANRRTSLPLTARRSADAAAHLEPVDTWHQQVEHDGVDVLGREHVKGLEPLACHPHVIALEGEGAAHRPAHRGLVVDHEDPHCIQFHRHF